MPVLVIAESGGAASDIYDYCCPESDKYLQPIEAGFSFPIEAGSERDEAYVAACARLLPEIEALGMQADGHQ